MLRSANSGTKNTNNMPLNNSAKSINVILTPSPGLANTWGCGVKQPYLCFGVRQPFVTFARLPDQNLNCSGYDATIKHTLFEFKIVLKILEKLNSIADLTGMHW